MTLLQNLLRYWHTLRYLQPVQFYGRFWFKLARPRVDLRPAPRRRLPTPNQWMKPACRCPSLLAQTQFSFLNETRNLDAHGWDDPVLEKLWRYNLHYFDDLNAYNAADRADWHRALMLRWICENPPGKGTGWEPYPTSIRIVNWIKWALNGNELPQACIDSLAVQTRWLTHRMEFHLLGNHLFANAKALIFAGLFFEGVEANGWLARGGRILQREIPEQILSDGGHFERSTMYHALALEDMLDLCNISTTFLNSKTASDSLQAEMDVWRLPVVPMKNWLIAMCHPDGDFGLFNDAAIGIAPSPTELFRYADSLGFITQSRTSSKIKHLAESGYICLEQDPFVALLDVAPVGPDYLPGHAHADTLSFEMSLYGQRVLVNSGTSCYGQGSERLRQRGTAAHNAVAVNGQDSSEVWSGFRVARRARPTGLSIDTSPERISVCCAHNGYHRLSGKPTPTRQWLFGGSFLIVEDRVSGSFDHAEAYFHLHPDVTVEEPHDHSQGRLGLNNGRWLCWSVEAGALSIEKSTYHPRFGVSESSYCLVLKLQAGCSRIRFEWS